MKSESRAAAIGLYAAGAALAPSLPLAAALASPLALVPLGWWILAGANHWVAGFLAAAVLLPPLPVDLGNSGPHPALLFVGAGVLAGLARFGEWRLRIDPLGRSLLILFAILLASSASAAIYSGGAVAAGSLARSGLFGISLYVYFYSTQGPGARTDVDHVRAVRWLLGAAVIAAAFACLDFYFQLPAPAGYGEQFVWVESGVFRRAQGLFYEASTLGNFCAFFLTLIAVAATAGWKERILPRWALGLSGALFSAALVFSYSRASVVALVAALGMLFYLRRGSYRPLRWLLLTFASLVAGGAAAFWLFPAFGENYWLRLSGSFEYFFTDPNGILSGRLVSWSAVMDLLIDRPWLLLTGIGYKTLPYSELAGRPLVADNMYLSMLIETGVAGLMALLLVNFRILQTAWRAARDPHPPAALFGTWMFCFWSGEILQMLSGDLLTYWRVLPLYFWALACAKRLTGAADERPVP